MDKVLTDVKRKNFTVPGFGPASRKLNISCQIQLLKKNKEVPLFDLQTLTFGVSENTPSIAAN